jgi:hypothetical protein
MNVYTTTSREVQDAAATLCGMERSTPAFRNKLRMLPPLPVEATVGDVAREYLRSVLAELDAAREVAL